MKPIRVALSRSARRDIASIHRYLVDNASPRAASKVVEQLLDAVQTLAANPLRGVVVDEFHALGGGGAVRQLLSKPYRLLYHLSKERVLIVLACDCRRDYHTLLEQRMLAWPPG